MGDISGRIFTFGCSYTTYMWPCWSDLILYGNDGVNFGRSGAGFEHTLYTLLEADREYKFTPDDKIVIVFTSPIRIDPILRLTPYKSQDKAQWRCNGFVLTSEYEKYEGELYCVDGLLFKSFYNIILIDNYLKSKNLNFVFGSIDNLFTYGDDETNLPETNELIEFVKNNIEIKLLNFKEYLTTIERTPNKEYKNFTDGHPRPTDQLKWVNDILLKHIDLEINVNEDEIVEIEKQIDRLVFFYEAIKIEINYPEFFKHRINSNKGIYLNRKLI